MSRKEFNIEVIVHFPSGMDKTSYSNKIEKFRMEQIRKAIAMHPPKTQVYMLERLEESTATY